MKAALIILIVCNLVSLGINVIQGYQNTELRIVESETEIIDEYTGESLGTYESFITWITDESGKARFDFEMSATVDENARPVSGTITVKVNKGETIEH